MDICEYKSARIPVILDTDIGSDIDDTWALAMMLQSPELDIKLITTASDNTPERAKIVAKMLEVAGRTDIPVGIGTQSSDELLPQSPWVKDYDLSKYPGVVHEDGVGALVRTILDSEKSVALVSIGPLTNIAEALSRDRSITGNSKFTGMHGSVYRGYTGSDTVDAEYNIVHDVNAAKKVFESDFDMTITPVDTCGLVYLDNDRYRKVCESDIPVIKAVVDNYRIWLGGKPDEYSSILFDTVAVYLAFTDDLLEMNKQGIRITDDGYTVPDEAGKQVNCALKWKSLPAFEDFLLNRLLGTI